MRTIIDFNPEQDKKIEEFKTASVEKQRFLVHSGKIGSTNHVVKFETDEKLCYFQEELKPRMGVKGFVQRKAEAGFTYDKTKKKLSTWFGTNFNRIPGMLMNGMMTDLKQEWYCDMGYKLQGLITRMILERVIKGKITNPRDYVKFYVKSCLKLKGVSPEHYYNLFRESVNDQVERRLTGQLLLETNPGHLNDILRHSKNPGWIVENYQKVAQKLQTNMVGDIVKECKILGKKFDWSWSTARIAEEHKLMSREIRGLELEYIDNNTVEYTDVPKLPKGWELINNQKRLFLEGSEQDHCVYNYWYNVEAKTYFVLSIKDGANRITASIEKTRNYFSVKTEDKRTISWSIGQIYGQRNSPCPIEIKLDVESWLAGPEIQKFFESQQLEVLTAKSNPKFQVYPQPEELNLPF